MRRPRFLLSKGSIHHICAPTAPVFIDATATGNAPTTRLMFQQSTHTELCVRQLRQSVVTATAPPMQMWCGGFMYKAVPKKVKLDYNQNRRLT